jgi:hypothetical protein
MSKQDPQRAPDRLVIGAYLDVRERDQTDGGFSVELFVEGERVAEASVRGEALTDMRALLGMQREDVRKQLETALLERLERELARVTVTVPVRIPSAASPNSQGRLVGQYVYDVAEKIETGLSWYDVASDVVGPDSAPAIVRHRMRLEAQRLTRKPAGPLRLLLDFLEAASS